MYHVCFFFKSADLLKYCQIQFLLKSLFIRYEETSYTAFPPNIVHPLIMAPILFLVTKNIFSSIHILHFINETLDIKLQSSNCYFNTVLTYFLAISSLKVGVIFLITARPQK